VEPAEALADLTEISSQIESAVLAAPDGALVASTLSDDGRAGAVATNVISLLKTARRTADDRALSHVQAATREGCVFVAGDERHVLVAVTGPEPTTGLVFYDLKATLRAVAEEPAKPKSKPRRTARKKTEEGSASA